MLDTFHLTNFTLEYTDSESGGEFVYFSPSPGGGEIKVSTLFQGNLFPSELDFLFTNSISTSLSQLYSSSWSIQSSHRLFASDRWSGTTLKQRFFSTFVWEWLSLAAQPLKVRCVHLYWIQTYTSSGVLTTCTYILYRPQVQLPHPVK